MAAAWEPVWGAALGAESVSALERVSERVSGLALEMESVSALEMGSQRVLLAVQESAAFAVCFH
jgi:hypothetical protein